jgi:hypothetical protein
VVRESQRNIGRNVRDIDREIQALKREEVKLIKVMPIDEPSVR